MQITDPEAIKILNKVNSPDLSDHISDCPNNERDVRSDMQILVDELDWLLDTYEDPGCYNHEALHDARSILSRSKYGKLVPADIKYQKMSELAFKNEINSAKQLINEYDRLSRLLKRLQKQCYKTRRH